MTRYEGRSQFVEAILAEAGPHQRFTPDSVSSWTGTPLKDESGKIIGEMTEAWVDDGKIIRGRFSLTLPPTA